MIEDRMQIFSTIFLVISALTPFTSTNGSNRFVINNGETSSSFLATSPKNNRLRTPFYSNEETTRREKECFNTFDCLINFDPNSDCEVVSGGGPQLVDDSQVKFSDRNVSYSKPVFRCVCNNGFKELSRSVETLTNDVERKCERQSELLVKASLINNNSFAGSANDTGYATVSNTSTSSIRPNRTTTTSMMNVIENFILTMRKSHISSNKNSPVAIFVLAISSGSLFGFILFTMLYCLIVSSVKKKRRDRDTTQNAEAAADLSDDSSNLPEQNFLNGSTTKSESVVCETSGGGINATTDNIEGVETVDEYSYFPFSTRRGRGSTTGDTLAIDTINQPLKSEETAAHENVAFEMDETVAVELEETNIESVEDINDFNDSKEEDDIKSHDTVACGDSQKDYIITTTPEADTSSLRSSNAVVSDQLFSPDDQATKEDGHNTAENETRDAEDHQQQSMSPHIFHTERVVLRIETPRESDISLDDRNRTQN